MTFRKDYENDAWALLEDYFDKIHNNLFKVKIKGEEHGRIISDLRSHVQMKADEIIAHKDAVSYNDVLEIMKELGSPEEIANSFARDLESVQIISPRDFHSPEELASGNSAGTKVPTENEIPYQAMVPPTSPVYHQVNHRGQGTDGQALLKTVLSIWRAFQIVIFTLPWLLLIYVISVIRDYYFGYYPYGDFWYEYEYGYLYNIPFTFYIMLIFFYSAFIAVEYAVRVIIVPRMEDLSDYRNGSVKVFHYGLFSTLVMPVASSAIVDLRTSLLAIILVGLVLFLENLVDSDFTKHAEWKIKGGFQPVSVERTRGEKPSFISFIMATVVIYTVMIILLNFQLRFISYWQFFYMYVIAVIGFFFSVIALLVNIWLNRKQHTFKVFSIETGAIFWAFRWFIIITLFMIMYSITTLPENPPPDLLTWFFVTFTFFILPLLSLDWLLAVVTRKLTGLDYSLAKDIRKVFNKLGIESVTSVPVNPPLVSEEVEGRSVHWRSEPSEKARLLESRDVAGTPSLATTPVPPLSASTVGTNYRNEQLPINAPEIVMNRSKSRGDSTFLSYVHDILILYSKIALVAVFIYFASVVLHPDNDVRETMERYTVFTLALVYTLLILIISSYKLYTLSKRQEKVKPYYYWFLTFLSWLMVFTVFSRIVELFSRYPPDYYYNRIYTGEILAVLLLLASPFMIIQLGASKKLVFSRRDRNLDELAYNNLEELDRITVKKPS